MVFTCGDVKCKDTKSVSSLRQYGEPERIEKISKELTLLEKKFKDEKTIIRIGDLYEQLASIYFEKEDLETSLLYINKAFTYKRNTAYLNFIAGVIYGNKGAKSKSKEDISKAEQYYRKAISLKKDNNEALKALAILLFFYKKEREEPIKIMEEIYQRSRYDYHARFTLGRFYYETGKKNDALDVYLALQADLAKLPDSPIVQEYLLNCKKNIQKIRSE
jgi:tetratricopeptide (TPR) repeat protein